MYPTVEARGSVLCFSLVMNHPFVDGNKRRRPIPLELSAVPVVGAGFDPAL